jgi:hypothetical protein
VSDVSFRLTGPDAGPGRRGFLDSPHEFVIPVDRVPLALDLGCGVEDGSGFGLASITTMAGARTGACERSS